MMENHEYPYMSPKTATDVLKKETYTVEIHEKYLRTTPQIADMDQQAPFVYGKELENNLKEVARSFSAKFATGTEGGGAEDAVFYDQQCEHSLAWYRQLKDLPVAVIEDDGFWRYLTVAVLAAESAVRNYIAGKDIHVGAMKSNVSEDGSTKRSSDILAKRMYVRGRLYNKDVGNKDVGNKDAGPPKTGQEFESSHVYPGGTAETRAAWQKAMCTAFEKVTNSVSSGEEHSKVMERGRDIAKKVNAARSARVAATFDDETAKRIVEDLLP